MPHYSTLILYIGFYILLISCNDNTANIPQNQPQTVNNVLEVDYYVVSDRAFVSVVKSTGIISCSQSAEIQVEVSGKIKSLSVKNGSKIKSGGILAVLDHTEAQLAYQQSVNLYTQAQYRFENELINLGYTLADTLQIPTKMLLSVRINSGILAAYTNLLTAKYKLSLYTITSPIDGVVANLNKLSENYIQPGTSLCKVVSVGSYFIVFPILLEELYFAKQNTPVQIVLLSGGKFKGNVSEINPIVDANGMVQVKATFTSSLNSVLEGAKADIIIENEQAGLISVPHTALVKRGKYKVVYSVKNNRAIWNEVEVINENADFIGIKSGLTIGDTIIISNNYSIDDQSIVKLKSK